MKKDEKNNLIVVDFTKKRSRRRNGALTQYKRYEPKPVFELEHWLVPILAIVCLLGLVFLAK